VPGPVDSNTSAERLGQARLDVGMVSGVAAAQPLSVVGWQCPQGLQCLRGILPLKLTPRNTPNVVGQSPGGLAQKKLLGFSVLKALDHG
jgi:hypothetical protein